MRVSDTALLRGLSICQVHRRKRPSGTVRAVLCSRPLHETIGGNRPYDPGCDRSGLRRADTNPRAHTNFHGDNRSLCDAYRDPNPYSWALRR